ncbi:MAG: hypothetical protein CML68_13525 [Rhodobacteraceae bacterium]|nr:hypothetical protein [Paracoccaceae bacterium]
MGTNTYAINVTNGKEFEVEGELSDLGLHPWVPKQLVSKWVKEKKAAVWYDRPYVGKMIFCVIPAIYYRDVIGLKHVIGKPIELSRLDIEGTPAHTDPSGKQIPARYGLKDFKAAVGAEYADAERRRENAEWICQYEPGQALTILIGSEDGFDAIKGVFRGSIKRAFDEYAKLRIEVPILGRQTTVEVSPDQVRAG